MKALLTSIFLATSGFASQYLPRRQVLPASLPDFPTAASPAPLGVSTVFTTVTGSVFGTTSTSATASAPNAGSGTNSGALPVTTASNSKCGKGYTYCGYMLQSGGHNFAAETIDKAYCDAFEDACDSGIPKSNASTSDAVYLCMNDNPASIQLFCACGGKCLNEATSNYIAHCDKPCVDGSKCMMDL